MSATELLEPDPGALLIVGGAEDKTGDCVILRELVRLGGGPSARIAVLTVASQFPREVGASYVRTLTRLGAAHVEPVDVRERAQADDPAVLRAIEDASAVYFSGGIQVRIARLIGGTELHAVLRRRWEAGLVVGGTSAGAAAMSATMILGSPGPPNVPTAEVMLGTGLGFVPEVIVDQHFSERRRLGRLLTAVGRHPDLLGVGIDEDTAILLRGSRADVLGRGAATLVDARGTAGSDGPVQLQRVPAGHGFTVRQTAPVTPA